MARAAPSLLGLTISIASEDIEKPATSANIVAPRFFACSNSSKIKIAAPSPCTIPSLVEQNGRQDSLDIILRPSHAFIPPKHNMLSEPPVIAIFISPFLIKLSACPMA